MKQSPILSTSQISKEQFCDELFKLSKGSQAYGLFLDFMDNMHSRAEQIGYLADYATHLLIEHLGMNPEADSGYLFSELFGFANRENWMVGFNEKASALYDELIAFKQEILEKEAKEATVNEC